MVFSSFSFLFCFLPASLFIYFLAPRKMKNAVLLAVSLIFYAWGEPVNVILMLLSITINFAAGRMMEESFHAGHGKEAKAILVLSLIWNLLTVIVFKYFHFLTGAASLVWKGLLPEFEFVLPIGISFYTFQAISYIVDVYRRKVRAQESWISFALYISMFPQLIAGPIVRYSDVEGEIRNRRVTLVSFGYGCERFIMGLTKKVLFANSFGSMYSNIQNLTGDSRSVMVLWLGAAAYTFQIYFDFSGYSDMAIGLGRMLGFHFNPNFNYPYTASSITDFWRRWHISLSTWFKEYLYIPLGGNRKGTGKQIRNMMIVWILTGLWHGAEWNFIIWGIYYGILLTMEKFFLSKFLTNRKVYRIFTLLLIMTGWVIFANTSVTDMLLYLKGMFGAGSISFSGKSFIYYLSTGLPLMMAAAICSTPLIHKCKNLIAKKAPMFAAAISVMLLFLCIASLVYQSYNPFLYFRF